MTKEQVGVAFRRWQAKTDESYLKICGEMFHRGEKVALCRLCGKVFTTRHSLKLSIVKPTRRFCVLHRSSAISLWKVKGRVPR